MIDDHSDLLKSSEGITKENIFWIQNLNFQVDQEEGGDTLPQASLLPVPQNPSFQGGARNSRNTINYKSIKRREYKLQNPINYRK